MKDIAEKLRRVLEYTVPILQEISDADASIKTQINKWSKKELLGHLIDSACNNQQKFVRTMENKHLEFNGYKQDHWVDSQKYIDANWLELIDFWKAFNRHIAHIIENVDADKLSNTISIENSEPFTLEFIMKDYGEHLKHHLKQILPDAELESCFENIYKA